MDLVPFNLPYTARWSWMTVALFALVMSGCDGSMEYNIPEENAGTNATNSAESDQERGGENQDNPGNNQDGSENSHNNHENDSNNSENNQHDVENSHNNLNNSENNQNNSENGQRPPGNHENNAENSRPDSTTNDTTNNESNTCTQNDRRCQSDDEGSTRCTESAVQLCQRTEGCLRWVDQAPLGGTCNLCGTWACDGDASEGRQCVGTCQPCVTDGCASQEDTRCSLERGVESCRFDPTEACLRWTAQAHLPTIGAPCRACGVWACDPDAPADPYCDDPGEVACPSCEGEACALEPCAVEGNGRCHEGREGTERYTCQRHPGNAGLRWTQAACGAFTQCADGECGPTCRLGEKRCNTVFDDRAWVYVMNQVEVCVRGINGELRWTRDEDCLDHRYCDDSGDEPQCTCYNDCYPGPSGLGGWPQCAGDVLIRCEPTPDGCVAVTSAVNCGPGQCINYSGPDGCLYACPDDPCSSSDTNRCVGDTIERCGTRYDFEECRGWSATSANVGDACGECGTWTCDAETGDAACDDPGFNPCGTCGGDTSCACTAEESGSSRCGQAPGTRETCAAHPDGNHYWTPAEDCPTWQTCEAGGACVGDQCTLGESQCVPHTTYGIRVCEHNEDGVAVWVERSCSGTGGCVEEEDGSAQCECTDPCEEPTCVNSHRIELCLPHWSGCAQRVYTSCDMCVVDDDGPDRCVDGCESILGCHEPGTFSCTTHHTEVCEAAPHPEAGECLQWTRALPLGGPCGMCGEWVCDPEAETGRRCQEPALCP